MTEEKLNFVANLAHTELKQGVFEVEGGDEAFVLEVEYVVSVREIEVGAEGQVILCILEVSGEVDLLFEGSGDFVFF